ncbi:MAG: aminodeoxychorismate lyase [Endozoicomonadaceae bacterium]|nr:aminodeoxychorismate lyase [Endozoicomonadaceae bacterium]
MPINTWIDYQLQTHLPITDRGLAYGDGLFETMRVHQKKIIFQDLHWERLKQGCSTLKFNVKWDHLAKQQHHILNQIQVTEGILKLIVTRGSGRRGYDPHDATPRAIWQFFPEVKRDIEKLTQGIVLFPCKTRLAHQPSLAGMKHLNRLEQVLARQEWRDPMYTEGLMRDFNGHCIEGTMSNLFIVHHDTLITPDLKQCGVAGIMREWILNHSKINIKQSIHIISEQTLSAASEIFMCNSIMGIWPVKQYKKNQYKPGLITRQLQKKLATLGYDSPQRLSTEIDQ